MWLEAILAREDFTALLPELMPVVIHLDGGGSIELTNPRNVELVADRGLRVTCHAKVHWPVLGIRVPVTVHTATAIVVPQIRETVTGDRLVFTVTLEHADFAVLPDVMDEKLTEKINRALVDERVRLEWDFTESLSHTFPLPATLEHLRALRLAVGWGEIRVTADAVVLAMSFHTRVFRDEPRLSGGTTVADRASVH